MCTLVLPSPSRLLTPLLALIFLRTHSIASSVVLWMMWKMVVDTLCGRRRRIPRSLSFLLLFTAGGLLLFIKQKDLSEMVQQLYPPGRSPLSSDCVGRWSMRHLRIVQLAFFTADDSFLWTIWRVLYPSTVIMLMCPLVRRWPKQCVELKSMWRLLVPYVNWVGPWFQEWVG